MSLDEFGTGYSSLTVLERPVGGEIESVSCSSRSVVPRS